MMDAFSRDLVAALPVLKRRAMLFTRNAAEIEDLVADTVARALAKQDLFEPGSDLPAWLTTMMRRLFISQRRTARRQSPTDPASPLFAMIAAPAAQIDAVYLHEVQRIATTLPRHQQVALRLFANGATVEGSATAQGIAIGTARSRLSRARQSLLALAEA